jgi:CRP-like cAMP-binding protein
MVPCFIGNIMTTSDTRHDGFFTFEVGLDFQTHGKMIDLLILKKYGAKEIQLKKDDVIFREEEEALNYFQIARGSIKMITNSPDGKEFIQGVFNANDSFGEPPLFCNFPYPSTASAIEPSTIIKLNKESFFRLLQENFDVHLRLDQVLCQRLRYKSMVLSEISSYDPEHRIMSLITYFKNDASASAKQENKKAGEQFIVPFTRQQIADMSGLRVETVIRAVKKMEAEGKIKIIGRKISF